MLNLKVADLYADLEIKTAKYDAKMRRIKADMAALKGPSLAVSVSTNRVNAAKALIAQLRASAAKPIQVRFAVSPGSSGGVPAIYAWKKAIARGVNIPIGADTRPFFRAVRLIDRWFVRMGRRSTITMDLNTRRADAKARALQKQIQQLKAQAASVRVGMGGGLWGGRGGGGSPGGFGGGVASGLGLSLHGSPQMMAGEMAGRGIAAAVTTAANFEETMIRIGAAAGVAGPELSALKDDLLKIAASKAGLTAGESLAIGLLGAKQGVQGDQLREFVAGMAEVRSAVGRGEPIAGLADNLARLMHDFDLAPGHLRGIGSALVALDNASTASARDILDISQRASGPAHKLGYSPEQVMALATTMRDRGMTNETAGTAISQIMTKMATEVDAFSEALGMPTEELKRLLQSDPMRAFAAVLRKINDMPSAIDALGLTESLGLKGVRVKGGLLQLAGDVDNIAPRVAMAANERATGAAIGGLGQAMSGTTAAQWEALADEATKAAASLGQELKPATDGLAAALRVAIPHVGWALKQLAMAFSNTAALLDSEAYRRRFHPDVPDPDSDPNRAKGAGETAGVVNAGKPAATPKAKENLTDEAMVDAWRQGLLKSARFFGDKLKGAVPGVLEAAGITKAPLQFAEVHHQSKALGEFYDRARLQAGVLGIVGRAQAGGAANAAGGIWRGILGNAAAMREQAGARPTLRSYSSGLDFGRRLQEDILNHKGDEEQKKTAENTKQIADGVKTLVGMGQRLAMNPFAQAARAVGVLGP